MDSEEPHYLRERKRKQGLRRSDREVGKKKKKDLGVKEAKRRSVLKRRVHDSFKWNGGVDDDRVSTGLDNKVTLWVALVGAVTVT